MGLAVPLSRALRFGPGCLSFVVTPEQMPVLRCKSVWFFSTGDEKAFFGFAEGIKAVREVSGEGDEILLQVVSRPSEASLRDLTALFFRYDIEMSQLRRFCSPSNRHWFYDPRKFWFQKVFRNDKKVA